MKRIRNHCKALTLDLMEANTFDIAYAPCICVNRILLRKSALTDNHGRMVAMVCEQDGDKPHSKSIYPSALLVSHTRTGNPRRSFAKACPCWRFAPRMAILLLCIRASNLPPPINGRLADTALGFAMQQTTSDALLPSACCLFLCIPSYGLLLEPIPQSDWWLFVEVCMARVLNVHATLARELLSLPNSSRQPAPAAC